MPLTSTDLTHGFSGKRGVTAVSVQGHTGLLLDTALPAPISHVPAYYWPLAGESMVMVSDSAEDAAGGGGAHVYSVTGLDENADTRVVTVVLEGLTPIAVPGLWLRINRIVAVLGDNRLSANAGHVSISTVGGELMEVIEAGEGLSQSLRWSVPRNFEASVTTNSLGARPEKALGFTEISAWLRPGIGPDSPPFRQDLKGRIWPAIIGEVETTRMLPVTLIAEASGLDIWYTADVCQAKTVVVGGNIQILLRRYTG